MARKPFRRSASFWEAVRIAVDSLNKNKLRSFLTLLGIILATTTLISVTALIHGMNLYIATKVSNMGADGFQIIRMASSASIRRRLLLMSKRNPRIKREEYEFIREHATMLKGIGIMSTQTGRVKFQGHNGRGVQISGITANIPALNNIQVDAGPRHHATASNGVMRPLHSSEMTFESSSSKTGTRSGKRSRSMAFQWKWWERPRNLGAFSATRRTISS